MQDVSYYHITLDRHEIIFSYDIKSENLFLGKQALNSIPKPALEEVSVLLDMPLIKLKQSKGPKVPAGPFVKGKRAGKQTRINLLPG